MTSKPIELRQAILDNFDYEDKGREQATDAILDAFKAALPKKMKLKDSPYFKSSTSYGYLKGYNAYRENIKTFLEQAKELPTNKENK